jgi:DnaK suppressor protein
MAIELDLMRAKLIERREALAEQERSTRADRAPVTLDQESVGRLSRIDAMQVQAMALAQQRRRQSEEAAIEAALRRIKEGEYGYCLVCGEDIAPARLANSPTVTTCIECAKEI